MYREEIKVLNLNRTKVKGPVDTSAYQINSNLKPKSIRYKIIKLAVKLFLKMNLLQYRLVLHDKINYNKVSIDYARLHEYLYGRLDYFESLGIEIESIMLGKDTLGYFSSGANEIVNPMNISIRGNCPYQELMGKKLIINPHFEGVVCIPKWNR